MATDSTEQAPNQQSTEDSRGSEAYEALRSAIGDMFHEPVEKSLEGVKEQVESTLDSHEDSMGSGLTSLREEASALRNDIGKFLEAVQASHTELDEQVDKAKASADRAYSLLTDDQENSRLEQVEETLGSQSKQLKQYSQQLENLIEWQKTHSSAFEELNQGVEEHSSHIRDLDRRTDKLISAVEEVQKKSEEQAQQIKERIEEVASEQQRMLIGLSVWIGVITIALAVVVYLVG
jgi:DNA repair ATPase RecN